MTLLDDFKRFVADAESGSQYTKWAHDNPGDLGRWQAFRDLIVHGGRPPAPAMISAHGRELVDAGILYLDATASSPPPPPAPKLIGFATGAGPDTYTGMDAATRSKYLDAVLSCRGNVLRFDCVGAANEQALIGEARAKGLEVIPIVMQLADQAQYAARAKAVAAIAKPLGVTKYELGNEVNLHMDSLGSPETWTPTSNAAYDAIKAAQPGALVSTSGIAPFGQYGQADSVHMDMQVWFERAVQAGMKFDAVATHPYPSYVLSPKPEQATLAFLTDLDVWDGWAQTITLPRSIRATLDARAMAARPIWLTEVGVPTSSSTWSAGYDLQVAADFCKVFIARVRAEPRVTVCTWYSVIDYKRDSANDQGNFGLLLRNDWTPKPGAAAFKAAVI